MKKIVYVLSFLMVGTVMAQEKPTEVKEESEVKVVKTKDGDKNTEKKVKVVTRETSNVELDKSDRNKTNQDRVPATKKVEKMVMVDDDNDNDYDLLSKETYFVSGNDSYRFSPSNQGFDIAFDNDKNEFVKVGKAWTTHSNGTYLIRGKMHNGVGYFTEDGSFVIEYYNKDTKTIDVVTFKRSASDL